MTRTTRRALGAYSSSAERRYGHERQRHTDPRRQAARAAAHAFQEEITPQAQGRGRARGVWGVRWILDARCDCGPQWGLQHARRARLQRQHGLRSGRAAWDGCEGPLSDSLQPGKVVVNIQAREWVDRFQRYLVTERRVSPHTVSAYGLDLEALMRFCEKYGIEDWQHLKMADVRLFAGRQHARGLVASSVRRRISGVRSFLRFLVREGALAANPADMIQGPRLPRRLPGTLTVEQMAQLLNIPATDSGAVRDRAIMELLYSSALRLIELIRLDVEDLDTSGGTVRVLGKGNVTRIVPVGSYALKALAAWLMERRGIVKPGEPALFVGRYGRRLTGRAVQKRIEEWARLRKIPIRVTPHIFRHSCATHVLESSGS